MKITVEKEFLMTQLDEDTVLLNIKNGRYFSLNETGKRVWELLNEHTDTEKVLTVMLAEYDVDINVLRQDINNLISGLADAELVILA